MTCHLLTSAPTHQSMSESSTKLALHQSLSESSTNLTLHPTTAQNAENDHSSKMTGPPLSSRSQGRYRGTKGNRIVHGRAHQRSMHDRCLRHVDTSTATQDERARCSRRSVIEPPADQQRSDAAANDRIVIERRTQQSTIISNSGLRAALIDLALPHKLIDL